MKAVFGVFVIISALMFHKACTAPVVYQTDAGEVCGCLVDKIKPSKEQCNRVNFNNLHETIAVSNCGE